MIGVHVQVGEDERPVGEGLCRRTDDGAPAAEYGFVETLQRVRERLGALRLRRVLRLGGLRAPPLGVGRDPAERGADQLGLLAGSRRVDERHARGRCLGAEALHATLRGDEPGRAGQKARSALGVEGGAHGHAVAQRPWDVGPAGERARPHEDELPVRQPAELASSRPRARELVGTPFEKEAVCGTGVLEAIQLDPVRESAVVARKALARGGERLLAYGGQAIDPRQQPLALLLSRWVRESVRGVEGRHREGAGVPEREVRETRHPGLVCVQDVEGVGAEGQLEVRADADGDAEAALPRHRNCGAEGDDAFERLGVGAQVPQCAAAAGEIDSAVGRREDDDFVAAATQLLRRGLHVLVDRVRLRPRKRRDHADPKAHASSLARFPRRLSPATRRS